MIKKTRATRKPKKTKPKINGRPVHSDFEFKAYKDMKAIVPKGAVVSYETERLEYVTTSLYRPDFPVEFKDGRKMYIEAKGYFKYSDRAKMLAVRDTNPDLDIRFLFMRDSPSCLGKGSKMRPSEWADKHGFKWCIGEVPLEWFRDDDSK